MSSMISKKRLLKDYREIMKNKYISITPLENNIFEWHGNLFPTEGRYKGIILHIIMKFPENYPSEPPVINLLTGIPHSNIIDHQGTQNYLCIDMLKNFFWMEGGEDKSRPYSGWSSAYTVESIMLQLNSFLFDDFVENYNGKMKHTFYQLAPENGGGNRNLDSALSDLENAFKDSIDCKCDVCGHTYKNPFPKIKIPIPKKEKPIIRQKVFENGEINSEIKEILKSHSKINKKKIEKMYLTSNDEISRERLLIIMDEINKYNNIYPSFIKNDVPEIYITRFLRGVWKKLEMEPAESCNCNFCSEYNNSNADNEIISKKYEYEYYLKINNFIDKSINIETSSTDENYIWNKLYELGYDDNLKKKIKTNNISFIDNKISFSDIVKGKHKQNKYKKTFFETLSENCNLYILDFLENDYIMKIKNISREIEKLSVHPYLWEKREQICFYTKEDFNSDILGFDINISFFSKSEKIKEISTNLDMLSLTAYQNDVRKTVWNNSFQYWLPLYITPKHMMEGRKHFEKEICKIVSARKTNPCEDENLAFLQDDNGGLYSVKKAVEKYKNFKIDFKPKYCLEVLVTLMNTMCVNMMKEDSIISLKSLEGFCQFHRIILQYIIWYPSLKDFVNKTIENFIDGKTSKYYVHSLGEFIIYLSLTDEYNWNSIKHQFMNENFERSVLWTLKKYPEIIKENVTDNEIIEKSWDSSKVGKKLLAFNIYFNTKIIKDKSIKNIILEYDKYYGKPPRNVKKKFFEVLKKIKSIESYNSYFYFIEYDYTTPNVLSYKLRKSIQGSEIKKYHNKQDFNPQNKDKNTFIR